MIHLEEELYVDCPIAEVFAFASDVTQWPEWRSELTEATQTTPGPVGVGTKYHLTGAIAGHSGDLAGVITEYEPTRRFGFCITSGPIRAQLDLRVNAEGAGTRLHLSAQLAPQGMARLAEPMIARQAERIWRDNLAHLKSFLESRR